MKVLILFFSLFFSIFSFANEEELTVVLDGFIVDVVDFEEGDKLKLFEAETGDHVLSKSYSNVDLSQLPIGSYVLENSKGQSINIDRLEEMLAIEGGIVIDVVEEDIVVEDAVAVEMEVEENINTIANNHINKRRNALVIEREGDVIRVTNFEEGDKIKLFEVKDDAHILTKTSNIIDLGLLPAGAYLLENTKGQSVIVEKFMEAQNTTLITDL